MDPPSAGNSRVDIRRLRALYLVPREHPAPERVRDRLDTATRDLPQALAAALSAWLSGETGLWLIRRLDVEMDVNAAWDREALTGAWTREIARTLGETLRDGEDGENVLWFPDRAAYLARFLVDLAGGRAWNRWQYEAFEGLRLLALSAGLRSAICEHPATGGEALLQLDPRELKSVLDGLTSQDARRVLDTLAGSASSGAETISFEAAWSAWGTLEGESLTAGNEWRNALRLYLAACPEQPGAGGPPLRAAVLALPRLARRLADCPVSEGRLLIAALTGGDPGALYSAAGTDAEVLAPLLRLPGEWVRDVGQALLARGAAMSSAHDREKPERRSTPFGGVFLLLPLLDELPLHEARRDWPDADGLDALALVRFLLLIKCLGQPRAGSAFYDPAVRDLMAVPRTLSPESLTRWQRRISESHQRSFLTTLEEWHAERGAVSHQTLILARAPAAGRAAAVLLDGARGVWLDAITLSPKQPERLVALLRLRLSMGGGETVVLADPSFIPTLERTSLQVPSSVNAPATQLPEAEPLHAGGPARLDQVPADLAYLLLRGPLKLDRPLDLALSVAAQGLLRAFSWRLPGFAASSLPYLYRNFLDFPGSVEEEPERRVVRLGRPPLHLVLNLTGMIRGSYSVSWLDARPLALFAEG